MLRVLGVRNGEAALFAMAENANASTPRSIRIKIFSLAALNEAKDNGQLELITDPYANMLCREITEEALKKAQEKLEMIKPVVSDQETAFNKQLRISATRQIYARQTAHMTQEESKRALPGIKMKVTRALWDFYQKGQSIAALQPEYGKNRGKERKFTLKKPGRKAADESGTALTDEVKKMMAAVCKKYLLTQDRRSVKEAHIRLIAEYKKRNPDCQDGKWPSYAQLYRFYHQNYNAHERAKKRFGSIAYNKDHRPLHGSASQIGPRLGSVYMIDATQGDLFLCSQKERKPIGRPWYYVVTDAASGMIAAVFASLEPPRFSMACKAIYMAIAPKEELLVKLGIDTQQYSWDISGIPAAILSDNAELQTDRFKTFLRKMNVKNSFHPPYRADCKGGVEVMFRLLNKMIGDVYECKPDQKTQKKEGHKEQRHLAYIDLPTMQKFLVQSALLANLRPRNNTPDGFPLSMENTPNGNKQWLESTGRNDLISPPDLNLLRLLLLTRFKPSFGEHGISFKGITWICKKAMDRGLFERNAPRESSKGFTAVFDPDDISTAWLFPDIKNAPTEYWECTLAPRSAHLRGMTQREAMMAIQESGLSNKKAQHKADAAKADTIAQMQKDAEEEKRKTNLQSKPQQSVRSIVAGIDVNRAAEINAQAHRRHEQMSSACSKEAQSTQDETTRQRHNRTGIYPESIEELPD